MHPIRIVIQPILGDEPPAWAVRSPGFETKYATRTEAIRAARTDANRRMTDGFDSQLVILDGDGKIDHVESFTKVSASRAVEALLRGASRPSAA
jgi:hypothetical protein